MLSDSKFPLWRADLKNSGFACEFAEYVWTIAVSGKKKLRIKKYPDTCGRGLRHNLTFHLHRSDEIPRSHWHSVMQTVVDKTLNPSPWTTQMDYLKWITPKNSYFE